jgi:hypothetical protein
VDLSLLIAGEQFKNTNVLTRAVSPELIKEMQSQVTRARFEGGQDNLPALEAAWDLAEVEHGVVLWIHATGPVLLSAESGLRQRLERNVMRTRLLELQTQTGPDRLLEKLDGLAALQRVPRLSGVDADLRRLLGEWSGKVKSYEFKRERAESSSGIRVGRNIERLFARDETLRLAAAHKNDEATALATKNQLVTPLTGAVVLELKEQYDRHGLTPADVASVPSVPEPSILSLLGIGIFAFYLAKKRRKHRERHV